MKNFGRRSILQKWSNLKITGLSSDGSGISRTSNGVIFVNGALPNEIVTAEIIVRKKDFMIAKLVSIEKESQGRIIPKCKYYGKCGGCQLQHADYKEQLKIKSGLVIDAMTRIGNFSDECVKNIKCEASPDEWHYRNKASFPVQAHEKNIITGFYRAGTHKIEPIKNCPVNAENINHSYKKLLEKIYGRDFNFEGYNEKDHKGKLRHIILRTGINTGENLLSFVINGRVSQKNIKTLIQAGSFSEPDTITINYNSKPGNIILGEHSEPIFGSGIISERLDEFNLAVDTSSFFQVNTRQAEKLFTHVKNLVSGEKNILELYSGVGSLTCYLAKNSSVTSIEEWRSAVSMARKNLKRNNLNVNALCGKSEDLICDLSGEFGTVVLDPPRDGCERIVLDEINRRAVKKIIYVSCNPSTLARDCKILSSHGYKLRDIKSFDMFPQTVHVETVAVLSK